jgi:hypothetical protein
MYRLDSRYNPSVNFPCTTADLLADIARHYDFEVGFEPARDVVEYVPRTATCREVIGYIAGVNGGFAKFDRSGVLQLKKLALCDFALSRNQYTELSVKADMNEVRQIEFINEDETFSSGKGTKMTTYRQHNPFGNREAAVRVLDEWNGFSYHGLTVKMRGLPYLESGDAILVQDDFDNTHYFALISDYTLMYNGGLTGRLVSKAKNPIDDYDEPMTQQRMMESMSENLRVRYINHVNENDIWIGAGSTAIASINFNIESRTFAVFNSQFSVKSADNCIMTLEYFINNVKVGQTPQTALTADRIKSVCLYNCFRIASPGRSTLTVTANINNGTAVILEGELIASVSGQYMLGDGGAQRPEINILQAIGKYELNSAFFTVREMTARLERPRPQKPAAETEAECINTIQLNTLNLTLNLTAELLMDSLPVEANKISANQILLLFTNTIEKAENTVNFKAFVVSFGVVELEISSIVIDNNEIIITTENLSAYNELVIKYDSKYGNLLSGATRNPLQSFNYILNLEEEA